MRKVLIGVVILTIGVTAIATAFFKTQAGCNFLRARGYKGCCPGDLPDLVAHHHAYKMCHLPFPNEPGTLSIYFEVKNQGCVDAGAFTVELSDTLGNPLQHTSTRVASLAAGATTMLTVPRPIGWCGGHDCQVKINIDSQNEVAESNEANNVSFELCGQ